MRLPLVTVQPQRMAKGERLDVRLASEDWPERKEQVGTADLAFVAFVIIIVAIAVGLTCAQIYMQNPR
jgi:hypothetical protein